MTRVGFTLYTDTARCSGWCIRADDGPYHSSGECDIYGSGPDEVCAVVLALDPKAKFVLERPSHGGKGGLATVVGLGAARGAWFVAWTKACGTKEPRRTRLVWPAVWRSWLFGDTAKMPLREKLHAQIVSSKHDVGLDEAAAVCLSSAVLLPIDQRMSAGKRKLAKVGTARQKSAKTGT